MIKRRELASEQLLAGTFLKAVFLVAMCLAWVGLGVVLLFKHGVLKFD